MHMCKSVHLVRIIKTSFNLNLKSLKTFLIGILAPVVFYLRYHLHHDPPVSSYITYQNYILNRKLSEFFLFALANGH